MEPKGFRDRVLEKWRSIKDIAGEASSKLLELCEFLGWFLLVCLIDEKERLGEKAKKKRPRSPKEREKDLDEIIYKFRFEICSMYSRMENIEKTSKDIISKMQVEDSGVSSSMSEKLFYIEDFCLPNIKSALSEAQSWLAKMESHKDFLPLCQKMEIDAQVFSDSLTSIIQDYISPLSSVVDELKALLEERSIPQKVLESFNDLFHILEQALRLSQLPERQKDAALKFLPDAAERFKRALREGKVTEAIEIYSGEVSHLIDKVRGTVNDISLLSNLNEADLRLFSWLTELVHRGSAAALFKFLLLRNVLVHLPWAKAGGLP